MFKQLWQFELGNQLRKTPLYIYFLTIFIFTAASFATGSMPLKENEHINAPYNIALWCAIMGMLASVPASWVMGMPLYRDIEYQTKEYYMAYPITPAGYFWGRYFGAWLCMLIVAAAIPLGIFAGSTLGQLTGWKAPQQYGPDLAVYYLYPWITITLPSIFFGSSLFFGLVALTRNVKVIYSGGVLLFLSYFLAFFFLFNHHSGTVTELVDPFMINGVLLQLDNSNSITQNTSLLSLSNNLLTNRILWLLMGAGILLLAYSRFSFKAFFQFKAARGRDNNVPGPAATSAIPAARTNFAWHNRYRVFWSLVRNELFNLVSDRYFWIILTSGMFFLLLSFCMGVRTFDVPEFPRTVLLYDIFNDTFPFYIFLFILFYTGEVLHRERTTRFAIINDALPPGIRTYHGAKLSALLLLGLSMALLPAVTAVVVQAGKGFYQFNWTIYVIEVFVLQVPRLLELVVFSYFIHVIVNHKFAAHGIAGVLWIGLFFLRRSELLGFNLLLYAYTPGGYEVSDMDGLGHMLQSIMWFHVYWLSLGGLLVLLSALFYYRGTSTSFSERLKQARDRFRASIRWISVALITVFVSAGGYIYFNVSCLNSYLTSRESKIRQVLYEKALKPYARLPLPKVTAIRLFIDLFPSRQEAYSRALIKIANRSKESISQLLLDGDGLTEYYISCHKQPLEYTNPLSYPRGIFNWFRPKSDPSEFRLYHLAHPLQPGDSLELEVHSVKRFHGFANALYAESMLYNGTIFNGGLPSLGYDPGEELADRFERRKFHLPEKKDTIIAQNDPAGFNELKAGPTAYLFQLEATISTDGDQTIVTSGQLQSQWRQHGRNYFRYNLTSPGIYMPLTILSARYAIQHDTTMLNRPVGITIYYHPQHAANIGRFIAAFKDGLHVYSAAFGLYPFSDIRLAETNVYQNYISNYSTLIGFSENFGWNANFTDPNQFDYCYFRAARALAQQWWRFQVAPNNTSGSLIIPEGLSTYSALMLLEKKYGGENMRDILRGQLYEYFFRRTRLEEYEHPLATIDAPYLNGKAGVVLYGLKNLIGMDSINTALRDFRQAYAFKNKPPFAGNNDLYYYLQKHIPDSLRYYLEDNWQHITFYDNKLIQAKAVRTTIPGEYKVTLTLECNKSQLDENGNEYAIKTINDVITVGVFADNTLDKEGRPQMHPLFCKNYRLTAGRQVLTILVKGKPGFAGIDPYATLIDRNADDNLKGIKY